MSDNSGYDSGDAKTWQREQVAEAKQAVGLWQRCLPHPIKQKGCGKCCGGTGCKQGRCFGELYQAYKTKPGNQVVPGACIDRIANNERCRQQGESNPKRNDAIYPPRQFVHEP